MDVPIHPDFGGPKFVTSHVGVLFQPPADNVSKAYRALDAYAAMQTQAAGHLNLAGSGLHDSSDAGAGADPRQIGAERAPVPRAGGAGA